MYKRCLLPISVCFLILAAVAMNGCSDQNTIGKNRTVTVRNEKQFIEAVSSAKPGTTIQVADGDYNFDADVQVHLFTLGGERKNQKSSGIKTRLFEKCKHHKKTQQFRHTSRNASGKVIRPCIKSGRRHGFPWLHRRVQPLHVFNDQTIKKRQPVSVRNSVGGETGNHDHVDVSNFRIERSF